MSSNYENFFDADKFAVVGNSSKMKFPVLSYRGLKNLSKTVYPVDPSALAVDGDKTYKTLDDLPEKVEGVIIEVPKKEAENWIKEIVSAGIKDVWIHMGCDTREAVELAKDNNINLRTGTCAVMYVTPGPSYHSIHKWIMKILGKY
ncbi:CoA-binding protein [Thermodesulfobacteriota bacterium]